MSADNSTSSTSANGTATTPLPAWVRRQKLTDDAGELSELLAAIHQFQTDRERYYAVCARYRRAQLAAVEQLIDLDSFHRAESLGDLAEYVRLQCDLDAYIRSPTTLAALEPAPRLSEYVDTAALWQTLPCVAARQDAERANIAAVDFCRRFSDGHGPSNDAEVRGFVAVQVAFYRADLNCLSVLAEQMRAALGGLRSLAQRKQTRLMATDAEKAPKPKVVDGAPSGLGSTICFSADYRSLRWGTKTYTFSEKQAAVCRALWEARQQGPLALAGVTLLDRAESSMADNARPKLSSLFKGHPAWKRVIISAGKGLYKLAEPPIS